MAAGPIKWSKSKNNFIEYFHNKVISTDAELKRSFTLDELLEKYEKDNDFKEFIDLQENKKQDKFIEQCKKGFSKLIEKNPDHQSYAGKIGGLKGGKAGHASMLAKYGEGEYKKIMKARLYDNIPDKKAFHTAGQSVSSKNMASKRDEVLIPIINSLPKNEWFDVDVLKDACKGSPILSTKFKILYYHNDKITSNGARGSNIRYKIIAK